MLIFCKLNNSNKSDEKKWQYRLYKSASIHHFLILMVRVLLNIKTYKYSNITKWETQKTNIKLAQGLNNTLANNFKE